MKTISTNDLANVTGGKAPSPTISTGGDTGGSSNEQLLSALQGIQSSLKDLGKNQNQGGLFGGQNGLLFMTMALAMSRRSEVVVTGGNGCRRGSYSWRVGW